ncbi:MAG: ArsC family reductase [Methylococcaceae bacterium]|nr:ArsC family reductase [Methylococcaceae bacterium]MCI0732287.1 ArsC family reductase [Methylococcaceae bacterium]
MLKIYGIKNCDAVKRSRKWLEDHGHEYIFHDFRSDGLDSELLDRLAGKIGWDNLINRRGTTWRQLPESARENLDEEKAKRLMLDHPTLIKRPVIEKDDRFAAGFSADFFSSQS